jgi:2-dehydropantoate 2-reductase
VTSLQPRIAVTGLRPGDFDLILICVKSYDTAEAVSAIAPLVDRNTLVCAYQNGLGNADLIAESLGWRHVVGARAIYGVLLKEPGLIDITVIANPTALGVYHAEAPDGRVKEIVAAMDEAGLPTVYTDEIATVLWAKVAYNSALNPLSALLDVPYGALLDTEHTRLIMEEVIHELYAAANAMGVPLKPSTPDAYVQLLFEELIPPTAAHYASMREDFRRKRRTEIDSLNGAVCRYGKQYGVPCPTNLTLTRLVHAREHALGVRPGTPLL